MSKKEQMKGGEPPVKGKAAAWSGMTAPRTNNSIPTSVIAEFLLKNTTFMMMQSLGGNLELVMFFLHLIFVADAFAVLFFAFVSNNK